MRPSPADPSKLVRRTELARIEETFGTHGSGVPLRENRTAVTPGGRLFEGADLPTFAGPARRTAYVLADGVRWTQFAQLLVNDDGGDFHAARERTYRPGEHLTQRYLMPVATSAPDYAGMRDDGALGAYLTFAHGPEDVGSPADSMATLTVWRDGKVIAKGNEGWIIVDGSRPRPRSTGSTWTRVGRTIGGGTRPGSSPAGRSAAVPRHSTR